VRDILGDSRLVARSGDPEDLAACISYVLELGEPERRALGLRQRSEIETRFDMEQVWYSYCELYLAISA